jgi:hydroxymethylbilane synthase
MSALRIGTRGSPLALWQAEHVRSHLTPIVREGVELILIETEGDRVRDRALSQMVASGGDGLFTKEIQNALLDDRVDVAVHSLKDLPTTPQPELKLGAVPDRGPTGDAFVSRKYARFDDLPQGAVIGTSSLRRKSQLLHRRPDLQVVNLRGNVETRLRKLDDENLDAIILAEAGLRRLGLGERITEILDVEWMLPAVGQGALGLECRLRDERTTEVLDHLNDATTLAAVVAERALLRGLGGGCLVPIGALAIVRGAELHLRAAMLSEDGKDRRSGEILAGVEEAETAGQRLAQCLLR